MQNWLLHLHTKCGNRGLLVQPDRCAARQAMMAKAGYKTCNLRKYVRSLQGRIGQDHTWELKVGVGKEQRT